jgi:hypothetical protein
MPVVERIETSLLATTIRDSSLLTGLLSGVHLVGMAVVVGAAVIVGLTVVGWLPAAEDVDATSAPIRAIGYGLMLNITSGILLVLPRLSMALSMRSFQTKMALLAAAAIFHLAAYRRGLRASSRRARALAGSVGVALWYAVALAGCAFILYE